MPGVCPRSVFENNCSCRDEEIMSAAGKEEMMTVEARNLTKAYGKVQALRDVSFTLESGKVYGLLGVNGAGKTTTLQLLSGYLTPTSGEVLVDGTSMSADPVSARSHIGYLPEVPPLYPELTVEEFLGFQAELRRIPKAGRAEAVRDAFEVGRLHEVRRRLIGQLSKGFRQRVGLAATLMGQPEVLLLDEPTNGLDPVQMVEMRRQVRELGKDRIVVVSSHVLSEITKEADEILIIAAGRLVLAGPKETLAGENSVLEAELKGNEETVKHFLEKTFPKVRYSAVPTEEGTRVLLSEEASRDLREPLFAAAAKERLPILKLGRRSADLEDLFLRVTEEAYREEVSEREEEEDDD